MRYNALGCLAFPSPYDVSRVWVRNHRGEGEWVQATWKYLNRAPVPFGDLAWDHVSHQLPKATEEELAEALGATKATGARVTVHLADGRTVSRSRLIPVGAAGPDTRARHSDLVREKFLSVGGPRQVADTVARRHPNVTIEQAAILGPPGQGLVTDAGDADLLVAHRFAGVAREAEVVVGPVEVLRLAARHLAQYPGGDVDVDVRRRLSVVHVAGAQQPPGVAAAGRAHGPPVAVGFHRGAAGRCPQDGGEEGAGGAGEAWHVGQHARAAPNAP